MSADPQPSLISDVDRALAQLLSVQQTVPGTEVNLPEDLIIKIGMF